MGRLDDRLAARAVPAAGAPEIAPTEVGSGPDEGEPVGPSPEEEPALLGTQREPDLSPATTVRREETPAKLPPLDSLVARIPPAVREALDDLFRAKFTVVRRVPPTALK